MAGSHSYYDETIVVESATGLSILGSLFILWSFIIFQRSKEARERPDIPLSTLVFCLGLSDLFGGVWSLLIHCLCLCFVLFVFRFVFARLSRSPPAVFLALSSLSLSLSLSLFAVAFHSLACVSSFVSSPRFF